jgi:hypothetical protein
MDFLRSNIKAVSIAAGILFLIIFNLAQDPGPTEAQKDLDQWVSALWAARNKEGTLPPTVSLRLKSVGSEDAINWSISATSSETSDRILRLIELAREASPKGLAEAAPSEVSQSLSRDELLLSMEGEGRTFIAKIPREEFESNIKIQNMVKLFQIAESSKTLTALRDSPSAKN